MYERRWNGAFITQDALSQLEEVVGVNVAIPMKKEEYRAGINEVAQRLLENPDFVAQLTSFLSVVFDGQLKWYPEALMTFGQMTKLLAHKAEDQLSEEHFDQKDF